MAGRLVALVPLLVWVAGCTAPSPIDLRGLLPDEASPDGWRLSGEPVSFGPDDLYDYLDGGAERYLSYGFHRLVHARYERADDDRSSITLDVFDMGSELGAFGIYSMARRPDSRAESWGAEGWCGSDVAHAWKGRVYVHGLVDVADPTAMSALPLLMAAVAGQIPGEPSQPSALDPLPVAGRVPRTEQYVGTHLLGYEFLPGGVVASYRIDGGEVRLFYTDLDGESRADEAIARLRRRWQQRTTVIDVSSPGSGGFRYSDAELGSGVAVAAGRFVAVVQSERGDLRIDAARGLLGELAERLPNGGL